MKAIVYEKYGPADVLRHTDVDRPVIGDDQVLVRVRAASVNAADRLVMRGSPYIARAWFGLRRPRETVLGRDIAGTVEQVGAKVTGLQVGDEVCGEMDQRGFAEYVAAPEAHLARKPAGVTFEQAASLPVAGTTALQAVRLGQVGPGTTVLVNGASGGVGSFAVQLARTLGAQVTGVCGTRNVDLVRSIGAHHVIDHTREDVTRGSTRFDTIIDLAADHSLSAFRRVLSPEGVYISSNGTRGAVLGPLPRLLAVAVTSPFLRQKLRGLIVRRSVEDLDHLAGLVAAGKIAPAITRTLPLAEAADALRLLEGRNAGGKIVLTV
ncbi:NAD(P)-dependent alcohol dehydrogenase [Nonomuraea sp. NPDC003727]